MKQQFNATTAAIQGSGWGWIVSDEAFVGNRANSRLPAILQGFNPSTQGLEIVTTVNQDPLLTHVPIIGVDIWEHAFYLQYLNVKADVCQHQPIDDSTDITPILVPQCHLERHQLR